MNINMKRFLRSVEKTVYRAFACEGEEGCIEDYFSAASISVIML